MFFAGLMLGVAGGVHCTAMCGPLIASVSPRGWNAALHHAGRSMTYLVLGLAAGVAGAGVTALGFGRWVSWIAAACVLIQALSPLVRRQSRGRSRLSRIIAGVVARVREVTRAHPKAGALGIGIANGLLPCGLVYAATIAASGAGSVASGVLLMAGFAAGTTAILATAGALWSKLADRFHLRASRLAPVASLVVALLLVWRGWSAAIPVHHIH